MNSLPIADDQSAKVKRAYTALIVLVIWFALVLQFSISIATMVVGSRTTGGVVVQFFSYFTILGNLLVVLSLSVLLFKPVSAWGRFFSNSSVITAAVLYITIVGIVYNIILRPLWHPQGSAKLADELLHSLGPVLFIIYWLAFVPKGTLLWKNAFTWLCCPFLYLVYILIRGAIFGLYPYPFVDVAQFGYGQIVFNSFILLLVFLGLGFLFVFIDRLLGKASKTIATS